jgi:plasmid stabilization system protein ParE
MVYFWNAIADQVAKTHPDKLLVVDAYSAYAAPPVARKLHPNLVVRFAPLGYHAEDYRQESLREWDGWSKAAGRIYFRPNLMLAGRRDGTPLLYVHKLGEDFRYLSNHGMMGTDFDSCCHNWATQGLNYYVAARLHWNAEQDVDAIVDDYCRAGFGPAAKSVRRYFDGLEALMDEAAVKNTKAVTVFTPKAMARLSKALEQARREAGGDLTISRRVAFLELGLRWTKVEAHAHTLLTEPTQADKAAVKRTLDERFALMRQIFRETPMALNVAYISWGEDALWSRLGWQRPVSKP